MRRGIFYGWVVAMALALLSSVNSSGSFVYGLFLIPLSQQFGVDRATLVLAPTVNRWLAGLLLPVGGYLADRFGSRILGTAGATLFGLSMIALVFARTVPMIYLAYGVLGGVGLAMTGGGMSARVIGSWFTRRRGTAMSLASGGIIIGQLILIPIATLVLVHTNWQTSALVLAGIVLIVIVPAAWVLIRNTPAEKGLRPEGQTESAMIPASSPGTNATGIPIGEAIRQPVFWQLALGLIACGATMSFPNNHLAAYTVDMGMSQMTASEAIGLAGLLSLPGALALGIIGDRIGRQKTLAVAYACRAITYFILLQAHDPQMLLGAGLVLGISWGATVPLTSAIVADAFGARSIATIVSILTAMMYVASGTSTYLAGLDYDLTGNYQFALTGGVLIGAAACIAVWLVRVPEEQPVAIGEAAVA